MYFRLMEALYERNMWYKKYCDKVAENKNLKRKMASLENTISNHERLIRAFTREYSSDFANSVEDYLSVSK